MERADGKILLPRKIEQEWNNGASKTELNPGYHRERPIHSSAKTCLEDGETIQ